MDEKSHIAEVLEVENIVLGSFSIRWDSAKRNAELVNPALFWTAEERAKTIAQGRIPYVFDKMNHPIGTILGTQRDARFDIKFYEREDADAHKVEIANAYWTYASDLYDFPHVESDVFQDGIISEYGVYGVEIDRTRDYRGNVRVSRVPYDEVIWDLNFRQYDLSDAEWQSRLRWYAKDTLLEKYPDQKEIIELAGSSTGWSGVSKEKLIYWFKKGEKDLIATREFYKKSWKDKFLIWKIGETEPDDTNIFNSKKEAEKFIREGNAKLEAAMNVSPMVAQGVLQAGGMPQFDIIDVPYQIVKKSEILLTGVLEEEEEFAPARFPYIPYFAYFHDGDFWTAVDRIKDPAIFVNRLYSQIDFSIGVSSKGALRVDPNVNPNQKKNIKDNWGKTGFEFEAKAGQVERLQSDPPPFQYFQTIDRVEEGIDNQFGGANFLGLKQTASESGRAVLARQAQAGLDNFVPLDNLRRSKQNLGELVAWYIKNYITDARKLRIAGDSVAMMDMQNNLGEDFQRSEARPNIGYLTMNTNDNNSIEDIEMDVVVDEAPHSATKKQAVLSQIADAMKGGLPAPPPEVLMPLFELPHSLEQAWLKSIEEMKKQPPPNEDKVSVNFKDMPASAQLQQLQKMGFDVQQSDIMRNALMKPEVLNNITKMITDNNRNKTMLTKQELQMKNGAAKE